MPLVVGETGDRSSGRRADAGAPGRRDHPFRRLDRRAGFGARSARLLPQQHRQLARADRGRGRRAACSISSSPRPRRSTAIRRECRSARTLPTVPMSPYGRSKLMTEIMLHDVGAAHGLQPRDPALLQRRRRRPAAAHRTIDAGRDASHQGRGRGRARPAAADRRLRHRLSDTPDGTCIRDYIHVSDLARAHVAALAHLRARRRERHAQLRLRPRLFGPAKCSTR